MESWLTGAETLEQTPPGAVPSQCWRRKTRAVRNDRLEAPRGQLGELKLKGDQVTGGAAQYREK